MAESDASDPGTATDIPFRYAYTANFPALLESLGISLFISTYQAGKLIVVRATENGLSTLLRSFNQAMGIAIDAHRLALGVREGIWTFRNAPDIGSRLEPPGHHD